MMTIGEVEGLLAKPCAEWSVPEWRIARDFRKEVARLGEELLRLEEKQLDFMLARARDGSEKLEDLFPYLDDEEAAELRDCIKQHNAKALQEMTLRPLADRLDEHARPCLARWTKRREGK